MWELWLLLALWGYLGYFFGIIDSLASFCHFWLIWLFCGINGYFQYYRQFWLFSGIGGDFGYFLFDCFLCSLTNLRFEIHSDLKYVDMKSPRKLLLHRRSKKFWCRSAKFWRSYAQIFLKCAAQSNFKMTEDRQRRRTKNQDEGQSFDILKTMIFHGGRIAIHLTCEICCSKMHSSPFFYSFWRCLHFPFRALLCGFLSWPILIIIKITKRIISGFSFIFSISSHLPFIGFRRKNE